MITLLPLLSGRARVRVGDVQGGPVGPPFRLVNQGESAELSIGKGSKRRA